jgi:hypothetical protein
MLEPQTTEKKPLEHINPFNLKPKEHGFINIHILKHLSASQEKKAYTVSRASCIWQNENGSYEAGPNSKCW